MPSSIQPLCRPGSGKCKPSVVLGRRKTASATNSRVKLFPCEGCASSRSGCVSYNPASVPRPVRRDGREAEGGGLLNRYRVKSSIEGSNPSLSASLIIVINFYSLRQLPPLTSSGSLRVP